METLFERGLVLPTQAVKKGNIQELARHSIGLYEFILFIWFFLFLLLRDTNQWFFSILL